jgi:hypothetical protein
MSNAPERGVHPSASVSVAHRTASSPCTARPTSTIADPRELVTALNTMGEELPLVFPAHPRTHPQLAAHHLSRWSS